MKLQNHHQADLSDLTAKSYLSGLAGMLCIIFMGYLAFRTQSLQNGWFLLFSGLNPLLSYYFPLIVCALIMIIIELSIRWKIESHIIFLSPLLKEKKFFRFLKECLEIYALNLLVILIFYYLYQITSEYGYQRNDRYYQSWFALMKAILWVYVWCGLFYTAFTRAFQHSEIFDQKEPAFLIKKMLRLLFFHEKFSYGQNEKIIVLGLLVKFFFIPVMSVFFHDQFTHLVNNMKYISFLIQNGFHENYNLRQAATDIYNISFSFIFSIDVGLAWCGYVISSRWIKNSNVSVEPSILGWTVALICYPPFQRVMGFYLSIPSEQGFFSLPNDYAVLTFALFSLMGYVVYMSATVVFGLRFSNLTHRGIIQTGPYSIIRHPAYASKNFAWWCVMAPNVLYQTYTQSSFMPLIQILGLMGMTGIYTLRALTEEKHLMVDPAYQQYCKKVRYRFFPGIC